MSAPGHSNDMLRAGTILHILYYLWSCETVAARARPLSLGETVAARGRPLSLGETVAAEPRSLASCKPWQKISEGKANQIHTKRNIFAS